MGMNGSRCEFVSERDSYKMRIMSVFYNGDNGETYTHTADTISELTDKLGKVFNRNVINDIVSGKKNDKSKLSFYATVELIVPSPLFGVTPEGPNSVFRVKDYKEGQ